MKRFFCMMLVSFAFSAFLLADDFDFKDPKGVNAILFKLESPLEPIGGMGAGVSGKLSFDGKDGKSLKGELSLAVDSIKMPNDDMSKYLKGEQWLDAAKFPNIKVSIIEVVESTSAGENSFNLKVKANVEIKGISKEMVIEVKATYFKDRLGERVQKAKGDLLVLKTMFTVKRDDFNIKPGEMQQVVANEISVTGNVTGACAK